MTDEKKPMLSFLNKIKKTATESKSYMGDMPTDEAGMAAATCPNCGAGRAKQDGVTHCAYCDFEFISVKITDGVFVNKDDNSKK